MKSNSFTHPIHARGITSPRLDVRGGKLLTDRRIHHYAKLGFYGTEKQNAALGQKEVAKRKKAKTAKQLLREVMRQMRKEGAL